MPGGALRGARRRCAAAAAAAWGLLLPQPQAAVRGGRGGHVLSRVVRQTRYDAPGKSSIETQLRCQALLAAGANPGLLLLTGDADDRFGWGG